MGPMSIGPGMLVTGNVRLSRPLGQGGMGSVWVAKHTALDLDVAVKFITDELLERESATVLARFRREAQLAAKLDSPHVVRVLDSGVTEAGVPYIVMELLRGEALSERIATRGRLPLGEAARIVRETAAGLEHAHRAGVVHRDIKPHNIFLSLSPDGRETVKLIDFGIAKTQESAGPERTQTGAVVGTPHYMSPEQLMRVHPPDERADIWALGVVAYELVTGQRPFDGETLAATIVAITRADARPPSALRPGLGPALDAFFAEALAVDPDRRPATAAALSAAFEAACSGASTTQEFEAPALRRPQPIAATADASLGTAEFLAGAMPAEARTNPRGETLPGTRVEAPAEARRSLPTEPLRPASLAPDGANAPSRRGLAVAGGVSLVAAVALGAALLRPRPEPTVVSTAPAASSPTHEALAVPAPSTTLAATTSSARLGNVPRTAVEPGAVPRSSAWLPAFSFAREDGDENATLRQALRACERRGMSLCTDAQWTRACEELPALGSRRSWTATADEGGVLLRGGPSEGGGACAGRALATPDEASPERIAVCCTRAIAVTSSNDNPMFLKTTAGKLLSYEAALASTDTARIAPLFAETSKYFGRDLDAGTVAESVAGISRTVRLLYDLCRVSLISSPDRRGWEAECSGLRLGKDDAHSVLRRTFFGKDALVESLVEVRPPVPLKGAAKP